ncbi:MAG: hypothetical protein IJI53_02315 [Clostridia bacterium]|nr:hypothetical protein [Clostridia bacterium]
MSEWQNGPVTSSLGRGADGRLLGENEAQAAGGATERAKKVTKERIAAANETLKKYKSGKARLEARLLEDEKWWQGHAWDCMAEQGNPTQPKRSTKWLVNVILGKHADMMDAYPEPVVLPREQGDEAEAKKLTSILPVVLEQNDFEQVYSKQAWEKNKHGTGAYAVYWDSGKLGGLGDIAICGIDMMNLFWEPGVEDIQKSQNVFLVSAQDKEALRRQYPQLEGEALESDLGFRQYQTETSVNRSDQAVVVDWYYHTYEGGQKTLQYCKYVGSSILYASEDDEGLHGRGWYEDGDYPFVLDTLYPQKDSPAGWGYIDLGKDTQEEIDLLSYAIQINARAGAIPRYFRKRDSAINLRQFMDFTNPVIEVEGGLADTDMKPVQHYTLDGNYVQILNNKIEELKQTCGNQDVSNGITSGVTAASGIAAQQEAAGRTSRDSNRGTYRAYSQLLGLVIERIRQFYDVPRTFRILGEAGAYEYTQMDNRGLLMQENAPVAGVQMGWRKPVFDIQVAAQKQNAYSKMAQNELAVELLNAGVFNPQLADQSMMLLDMMDFKGKDELRRKVERMGTLQRMLETWQNVALGLAQQYEPQTFQQMVAAMSQGDQPMPTGGGGGSGGGGMTGEPGTSNASHMVKAREMSRETTQPE